MPENQYTEYKEVWKDDYLKWIAGFANAQGGALYVGVDDAGTVVGLPNARRLLEDIPNSVVNTLGIVVDVNLRNENGKDYLEILVHRSSYPVNYHGEFFYRTGSTLQQLRGTALNEFLMRKTGAKWDAVPVDGITVQDLDYESLSIFRREAVRSKRMSEVDVSVPDEELLEKLGLMDGGRLKRAAVLLFYRNPGRFITGSYVKIGKFGEGPDLQYQDTMEESLMLTADRIVQLIYLKYLKGIITYDKEIRIENYPYAREAVREAIYNALIHNQWESGVPIQIRIQDDCMLISNSCVLPEGWTAENLLGPHKSVPYNPDIANTFYRAGYIESWGRGIQKIEAACAALGAEPPEYEVLGNGITLKLKAHNVEVEADAFDHSDLSGHDQINDQINVQIKEPMNTDLEDKLLSLLKQKPTITMPEMAEALGVSEKTIQRSLNLLRDDKRVVREGSRKAGFWRVVE